MYPCIGRGCAASWQPLPSAAVPHRPPKRCPAVTSSTCILLSGIHVVPDGLQTPHSGVHDACWQISVCDASGKRMHVRYSFDYALRPHCPHMYIGNASAAFLAGCGATDAAGRARTHAAPGLIRMSVCCLTRGRSPRSPVCKHLDANAAVMHKSIFSNLRIALVQCCSKLLCAITQLA